MAYDELPPAQAPLAGAGPRLKAAREAAGLSVAQISAQTKIPARTLDLIEAGQFAALPARAYAIGFTRTYARALGLDDAPYGAAVRQELGMGLPAEHGHVPAFEPGDPARVPTARFAWLAAVAALVMVAAGLFFWRTYYAPAVSLPSILPPDATSSTLPDLAPAAPPPATLSSTELPGAAIPGATGAAASGLAQAPVPARIAPAQASSPRRPARREPPAPASAEPASPVPLEAPVAASTAQN